MPNRKHTYIYCMVIIGLMSLAFLRVGSDGPLDTNILNLIATEERDEVVEQAVNSLTRKIDRSHSLLIFSEEKDMAKASAHVVTKMLRNSGLYSEVRLKLDNQENKMVGGFYFPYRYRLVDIGKPDKKLRDSLVQNTIRQLYSPMGAGMSGLFSKDPFFLFNRFLSNTTEKINSNLTLEDGMLLKITSTYTYVYIQATLKDSPFDIDLQEDIEKLKISITDTLAGDSQILAAGIIEHAIVGANNAKSEIAFVGGISVIGILLLVLIIFGSLTPIVASVMTIMIGLVTGFSATLLVFGQVHMITLVAGGSLIGISIDYSFHFFADQFRQKKGWSSSEALNHIWQGISLGLLTSIIAFAALLMAPFPGLNQLAVFSIAGLLGSFGSVVFLMPLFAQNMRGKQSTQILPYLKLWIAWWQYKNSRKIQFLIFAISLLFIGVATFTLKSNDDVRLLQSPAADIVADESLLKSLINQDFGTQFILVEGTTAENLLQREEKLFTKLSEFDWPQGSQNNWMGISSFIPSIKKQESNLAAISYVNQGKGGAINILMDSVDLSNTVISDFNADIASSSLIPLSFDMWYSSSIMSDIKKLWIGDTARGKASIVLLKDGINPKSISKITQSIDKVHYVDNVSEISQSIKKYREYAIYLLIVGYMFIAAILLIRYGFAGMVSVVLPPFSAVAITAACLAFMGEVMSLFTLVGFILVLGIGIDYTIFYREADKAMVSTMLAIFLSMASTVLTFGLLSFSNIMAIHSFGVTVMIGIIIAFLLAPMAGVTFPNNHQKDYRALSKKDG